jgi:virulence-associated protein VapD
MYAIAFDLDTNTMKALYPGQSWNNGYVEIKNELARFGFSRQQGSVYFGNATVSAVDAVLATQHLAKTIPWFGQTVRDIRMLRIEDDNDLAPAIEAVAPGSFAAAVPAVPISPTP